MGSFGASDETGSERLGGALGDQSGLLELLAASGALLDGLDGAVALGDDGAFADGGGSQRLEVDDLFESDLAELDFLSGDGFDPSLFERDLRLAGLGLAIERGDGKLDGAVVLGYGLEAAGAELEDDVFFGAPERAEADVGGVAIGDA